MRMLVFVLTAALACGPASAAEPPLPVWREPVTGMAFALLPKGCFSMGSVADIAAPSDSHWEHLRYTRPVNVDEKPAHQVCLDAFGIAVHEVSNAQWAKVMGSADPVALSARSANKAKGGISHSEALEFARRLGEMTGGSARFRLPSEAEWEYACRAGDRDGAPADEELAKQAWYGADEIEQALPRPVGQLAPNAFGLYDMLGNVWEWTADSYRADGYRHHALFNPRVDVPGVAQVIRGGSVRTEQILVRCAKRGHQAPGQPLPLIGLRLVREL